MVISGLLGVLREIYKLALLDFASGKEIEVAAAQAMTPAFFAELLRTVAKEGRSKPTESMFSRESQWAVGGSAKVERVIFEALRSAVFEAYSAAVKNPSSAYSKLCDKFSGSRQAAALVETV